jgi:hypothetical protein
MTKYSPLVIALGILLLLGILKQKPAVQVSMAAQQLGAAPSRFDYVEKQTLAGKPCWCLSQT